MPQISVVIPVYNKEKYLSNTIQSVLNQTFADFELILIDDGSTDKSPEIIKTFTDSRIRYYRQENKGVAIARNKGASLAQTLLIAFLDADDLWLPNHLQEIISLYQNFPDVGFYGTAYRIKYGPHLQDVVYPFPEKQVTIDKFYRIDKGRALFFMSNFAIQKDIFEKTGGFTPGIHAEDTEYFIRLSLQYPMAYSQEITMIHLEAADNSLFAQYKLEKKIALLHFFQSAEKKDSDLKIYLDMHRYVWTLEYLLSGKRKEAHNLKKDIDLKNLNIKQKLLIKLPPFALQILKKLQIFLKKRGVFLSGFSQH